MAELVIGEGMRVSLHFSLKLESGEVVDSNFEGDAATFIVGDGNLLPEFEKKLFGLSAGNSATYTMPPESAFGQLNPNNIQSVRRDAFTDEFELSVGLVVSFADAAGGETPGVIRAFDAKDVTIDFNHPLAGQSIVFDVKVLSVTPVVTH